MLDHPKIRNEPLLRPVGEPLQVRPHKVLCRAAAEGLWSEVLRLLDGKHDPNDVDLDCKTPLMHASKQGDVNTCALLVQRGANVKPKDGSGLDAVGMAANMGTKMIIEALSGVVNSSD